MAQAAQITVKYKTSLRISLDGNPVLDDTIVSLPRRAAIDLPGIGEIQFEAGGGEDVQNLDRQVDVASEKLTKLLAECGAISLLDAQILAKSRQDIVEAEKQAKASLTIIAPLGIENLQKELIEVEGLASFGDDDKHAFKKPDELILLISQLEEDAESEQAEYLKIHKFSGDAKEKQIRLATEFDAAFQELRAAQQAVGPRDAHEGRRLEAAGVVTQIQVKLQDAQNAYTVLLASKPDLDTVKANLARANEAVLGVATRLKLLREMRSGLSATIELQAANGIEERRDEIAGRLEAARVRGQLLASEVAALTNLRNVIQEARDSARDAYFGPVKEELAPLLRILHNDAAVNFDTTSMLPSSFHRGDIEEEIETLSGGTQEQIAILTRLAFANLLTKQGKSLPIILDDALVYSDDSRIIKMFTALHRAAQNQQIIVFTCRQLAFVGLGGTKPILKIQNWV